MANTIKPKRSNTANKVPNTSELVSGELGVNMADRKVYINNGTSVVQVGAGLLSALGDVAITSPSNGEGLSYNGTTWVNSTSGAGSVTSVSVVSSNGFAGTVANATSTPAITLSTSITGLIKGNGTALSAAVSGTDYAPATSGSSILYGNGAGGFNAVTVGTGLSFTTGTLSATNAGTVTSVTGTSPVASSGGATPAISLSSGYGDTQNPYASKTANFVLAAPNGTAGVPTFRAIVAADIPTLNQNTTGSAATLTTARAINGVNFNGSANITITANTPNSLTIGTGLTGTSFNGSNAVTVAIDSTVSTLTGTQTLTNKTLTAPKITSGIFDSNGAEVLNIVPVTSAVNEFSISNAATGGSVLLTTAGSDANINLLMQTKGDGAITIDTGTGAGQIDLKAGASNVRIWDDDSSHYYQFVTGNTTANYNITFPAGNVTLTAGTSVVTTRSISTTAPLSGGGDLSANRTISMTQASSTVNGWLSSTDWNTFNGKINLSSVITGYTVGTNTALAATDTLLAGLGKIQGQINARSGTVTSVGGTGTVVGLTLHSNKYR